VGTVGDLSLAKMTVDLKINNLDCNIVKGVKLSTLRVLARDRRRPGPLGPAGSRSG